MFCKDCNATVSIIPETGFCIICLQKRIDKTQPTKKEVKEEEEIRGLLKDPRNIDKINVPKVEVDPMLREKLKPYQRDGVKFLWRNCFSDLDSDDKGDDHEIGGCILAHYMGLGKSFTTITALHTALASRSMVKRELDKKQEQERPLLQSVLLIAPANTLTNWVDEVDKWTENLARRLDIMNLGAFAAGSRPRCIKKWKSDGGILLLSDSVFLRVADEITRTGHPDVFVLDEAHTMLTQSSNKGFRKLLNIQTKRKILLTGTPFQNNVTEYYRMVDYIRPGLIEVDSEAEFETEYRIPIERGLPSDASDEEKLVSMELQSKLRETLEPYVDRKGPNVLRELLPPIHDNLLELRSSAIQDRLIACENRARNEGRKSKNFFTYYSDVAPLLNHPGTLKVVRAKRGQKMSWKSEDAAAGEWFMEKGINEREFETMHEAKKSPKLIMLAHIVTLASRNGDKTLVYSKDLKTLDIVEWFLRQRNWKVHVDSLSQFKDQLGGWKKGQDFVRIDGSVDSGRRGDLVDEFGATEKIKVFLISSLAGGIGINLCAASVVVMMDNHFNPSVSSQCISRAHRLGQEKPVYCFRLAMDGTMETKIYARSVNKEGVSMQVVDGKFSERLFKKEELNDLQESNIIMTCKDCGKRRILHQDPPPENVEWTCSMNSDPKFNECKDVMEPKLEKVRRGPMSIYGNPILKHVVGVVNIKTRKTALVLDYLPVRITDETDLCCDDAITRLKDRISEASQPRKKKKL